MANRHNMAHLDSSSSSGLSTQANLSTSSRLVKLNIGGFVYVTSRETLLHGSGETFFSALLGGRIPSDRDETGAFFIDQNGRYFEPLLDYLRYGVLDIPNHMSREHVYSLANFLLMDLPGADVTEPRVCFRRQVEMLELINRAPVLDDPHHIDRIGAARSICLPNVDLVGISLAHMRLARCTFTSATFTNVVFEDCTLDSCDFRSCHFAGCRFVGAVLAANDFTDSVFEGCDFRHCVIASARELEKGHKMVEMTPSQPPSLSSSPTSAYMMCLSPPTARGRNSSMSSSAQDWVAKFDHCTFTSCDFEQAHLEGVSFEEASLTQCDFRKSYLSDVRFCKAQLQGLNFSEAELTAVAMVDSSLLHVLFRNSALGAVESAPVVFNGSQLRCIDMSRARLCIHTDSFYQLCFRGARVVDLLCAPITNTFQYADTTHMQAAKVWKLDRSIESDEHKLAFIRDLYAHCENVNGHQAHTHCPTTEKMM